MTREKQSKLEKLEKMDKEKTKEGEMNEEERLKNKRHWIPMKNKKPLYLTPLFKPRKLNTPNKENKER